MSAVRHIATEDSHDDLDPCRSRRCLYLFWRHAGASWRTWLKSDQVDRGLVVYITRWDDTNGWVAVTSKKVATEPTMGEYVEMVSRATAIVRG